MREIDITKESINCIDELIIDEEKHRWYLMETIAVKKKNGS